MWVGKTSPEFTSLPVSSLHVALDAKESAQRADDQRNHDRGSATAIEVRTDRNRDLRHDNADNASNHHQSAKHRDDDAPVAEFQFRYNNRFNPDIFGTAIAGCQHLRPRVKS